mgnify:CR=1 FL=1
MAKKIYTGVQELIGNTPLLEVTNIEKEKGLIFESGGKRQGQNCEKYD